MLDRQIFITTFAILLAGLTGCIAGDYSDLEVLGATCEGRDSCVNRTLSSDFFKRNCECDRLCGAFGDCCIDSIMAMPHSNRMRRCMGYGTTPNLGAYVISGCPRRNRLSEEDCLRPNMSDPLIAAPVSTPNGPTYFNAHCAECNGADLAILVPWTPLVNCETLAAYNLSAEMVWGGLKREGDDWGVPFRGQFHRCTILFDKPETVKNVRLCRADVVSTCPPEWSRPLVRRRCQAYTAVVHTVDEAFRNPHCALCNGVSPDELYCDRDELLSGRLKFSFALLFDVNRSDGDLVGISQEVACPWNQKYDPFHKVCRNLICAIPGYRMVGRRCEKTPSN